MSIAKAVKTKQYTPKISKIRLFLLQYTVQHNEIWRFDFFNLDKMLSIISFCRGWYS